jgi:hypothetical protein
MTSILLKRQKWEGEGREPPSNDARCHSLPHKIYYPESEKVLNRGGSVPGRTGSYSYLGSWPTEYIISDGVEQDPLVVAMRLFRLLRFVFF